MNTFKLLEIMPEYEKCPSYGNKAIGNGQGGIIVEETHSLPHKPYYKKALIEI